MRRSILSSKCLEIALTKKIDVEHKHSITCIRWKEIRDGITVFRVNRTKASTEGAKPVETSEELGKSSVAGARAVGQSASSRVLTNMQVFPSLSA